MKKIFLFLCFCFAVSASAQEKKKDSVIYEYKPRMYFPADCSCLGKVIYKELKPGENDFNPYHYQKQKPVKVDSLYQKKDKPKKFQNNIVAL